MAMFTEKTIGVPGYGANVCYYMADINVKDFNTEGGKTPLFVVPKGVVIVGAKATTVTAHDAGTTAPVFKVGTYAIAADGKTGAAIDDDAIFATLTTGEAGTVVGAAGAAKLYTDDTVVALSVTTPATGTAGLIRVEFFGVC